jgi:NAD dependent epimerase/dehydratase family enzyme
LLAGRLISGFCGGVLSCGQASLVGGHQRALDAPDADVVEVQAVMVAGLQGLDEEMLLGDPGEQLVELLGGFGVVLGRDGGALEKMLPAFKMGVGGIIGDGKMMTSWIDIDDLVAIYAFVLEQRCEGVFNATSPKPLTNYDFTKILGKVLHRPTFIPVPSFVIKILFGEGSTVLLDSKAVYPKSLLEKGFVFKYPDLESSLKKIIA